MNGGGEPNTYSDHDVDEIVADKESRIAELASALQALLALDRIEREFKFLDVGIGTATDAGRAIQNARRLVGMSAKGRPDEKR